MSGSRNDMQAFIMKNMKKIEDKSNKGKAAPIGTHKGGKMKESDIVKLPANPLQAIVEILLKGKK